MKLIQDLLNTPLEQSYYRHLCYRSSEFDSGKKCDRNVKYKRTKCFIPVTWSSIYIQWCFVYPDTFVPGQYFRINEFCGLLNRQLVRMWKSVPTLFVRTSEISRLSGPGLRNHHCIVVLLKFSYTMLAHLDCLVWGPTNNSRIIKLNTWKYLWRNQYNMNNMCVDQECVGTSRVHIKSSGRIAGIQGEIAKTWCR